MARPAASTAPVSSASASSIPSRVWCQAVDGEREALAECLRLDVDGQGARRHRLASTLTLRALGLEMEGPALPAWRQRLRQVTAHHMMLADALELCGEVLGQAGVRWVPIKGLDLCSRVYARPEERPTSDIDLLISARDLEVSREAFLAAGWTPLQEGVLAERYLQEDGYAWQARHRRGGLLELHFRLWGSVTASFGEALMERAEPDPDLPEHGHRLRLPDAYLVAAVHLWLDPPPRKLGAFRDLVEILRARPEVAPEIVRGAASFGVELPVLAATAVAAELWQDAGFRQILDPLESSLRVAERRWWQRQRNAASSTHAGMTLARHLAGRSTRHGLAKILWRRIWAHPGIVEAATEPGPSWIRRRLAYQARAFNLEKKR